MTSHGADAGDDYAVRKFRGGWDKSMRGRVLELSRSFDATQSRIAML